MIEQMAVRVERHGTVFSVRRVVRGGFRSRGRVRELRSLARAVWRMPETFMSAWEAEWDQLRASDLRRGCWHPSSARQSQSIAADRTIWCGGCGTILYSRGQWLEVVADPHACTCPVVKVDGSEFFSHSREHIGHEPSCPRAWWP